MRVLLSFALLALALTECIAHKAPVNRALSPQTKQKLQSIFKKTNVGAITPTYETNWYKNQKLDHFSFSNHELTHNGTWWQKFLVNSDNWRDPNYMSLPGPIFLYTGNEGPIETFANNTGLMFDLAAEFKALLVFVEHRYYGQSMPFGDDSFKNASTTSYLTTEQALADYSQFVDFIRYDKDGPCQGNCSNIPVISFGGSYGGMLAAYFRMKYPAATQGAISASAPVWQQEGMVDPGAFNHILTNAFARKVSQCPAGVQRSWDIITHFAQLNGTIAPLNMTGLEYLQSVFKPCSPFNDTSAAGRDATISNIYNYLSTAYSYMGMANYPYPTEFLGPMPGNPVDTACEIAFGSVPDVKLASNETILQGVYQIANVFWNYTGVGDTAVCNDMSSSGPSTLGSGPSGWDYQSCTEYVMPLGQYGGLNDMMWPAPWNLEEYMAGCQAQFGVTPDKDHMRIEWGGMDLRSYSRIVFTNGDLDPWSGGGVTDTAMNGAYSPSNTRGVVSYMIAGGAHHLDLRSSDPADPQTVIWVRQQQRNFIHAWIDGFDSPSLENASSGLDEKWIILISVFATLLAVVLAAILFRCCQSRREKANTDAEYAAMNH